MKSTSDTNNRRILVRFIFSLAALALLFGCTVLIGRFSYHQMRQNWPSYGPSVFAAGAMAIAWIALCILADYGVRWLTGGRKRLFVWIKQSVDEFAALIDRRAQRRKGGRDRRGS